MILIYSCNCYIVSITNIIIITSIIITNVILIVDFVICTGCTFTIIVIAIIITINNNIFNLGYIFILVLGYVWQIGSIWFVTDSRYWLILWFVNWYWFLWTIIILIPSIIAIIIVLVLLILLILMSIYVLIIWVVVHVKPMCITNYRRISCTTGVDVRCCYICQLIILIAGLYNWLSLWYFMNVLI